MDIISLELVIYITSFLSDEDKNSLIQTCKYLNRIRYEITYFERYNYEDITDRLLRFTNLVQYINSAKLVSEVNDACSGVVVTKDISLAKLPKHVKNVIVTGKDYELYSHKFPSHLTHITMAVEYGLEHILPSGLIYLDIPKIIYTGRNLNVTQRNILNNLPATLKYLRIGNIGQEGSLLHLSDNLETLIILSRTSTFVLPSKIKHLYLKDYRDNTLIFPEELKFLHIGYYNYDTFNVLPRSLETLIIGRDIWQDLHDLPRGLRHLTIWHGTRAVVRLIDKGLPPHLETLTVVQEYNYDYLTQEYIVPEDIEVKYITPEQYYAL